MQVIDPKVQVELEAAAFRRLLEHLRERSDVQNIDMMNLAGFCRNCLARWYEEAARDRNITISKDQSRQYIYGEPYGEWQAKHQTEATPEQLARYAIEAAKHSS